jgi:hypothetical protein
MIRRYLALVLVVTFMCASLPALAEDAVLPAAPSTQDAVSAKSLPLFLQHGSSSGLMPGLTKTDAFPGGQSQPTQSSKQWTKGGKIMTIIGAGLIAGGAVEATHKNTTLTSGCSGNTCSSVSVDWRDTGIITIGAGAALLIIGLTRRH